MWPPDRVIISPVSPVEHAAVRHAQRALRLPPTGEMDKVTRRALRGVQRLYGASATGALDPETAALIDRLAWTPKEEG